MTTKKKKRGSPPKGSRSTPQRTSPAFITPMAAQVVKALPDGDDWIYELKFDGYRALVIKDEQRVELRSRKNKDLTGMYPGIPAAGQRLKADQAVVDGEIVALDAKSATRGNCRIPPERLLRGESRSLQTARSGRRERGQRFPERRALTAWPQDVYVLAFLVAHKTPYLHSPGSLVDEDAHIVSARHGVCCDVP